MIQPPTALKATVNLKPNPYWSLFVPYLSVLFPFLIQYPVRILILAFFI